MGLQRVPQCHEVQIWGHGSERTIKGYLDGRQENIRPVCNVARLEINGRLIPVPETETVGVRIALTVLLQLD